MHILCFFRLFVGFNRRQCTQSCYGYGIGYRDPMYSIMAYTWATQLSIIHCSHCSWCVCSYGLFTPPTRTRQTVLSCLQLCSHRHLDKTTVLSRPCRRCEQAISCKQEAGSRRDKIHRKWVETRHDCLVGGVNKSLEFVADFHRLTIPRRSFQSDRANEEYHAPDTWEIVTVNEIHNMHYLYITRWYWYCNKYIKHRQ